MKYNYITTGEKIKLTLSSITLIGIIAAGGFMLFKGFSPADQNAAIMIKTEDNNSNTRKKFKAGEHIISTSINLDKKTTTQIPYHIGYKLQGITIDSDGKTAIYTNTEDVFCTSQGKDENNNDVFNTFGITDHYETSSDCFNTYEHTLAVPISNPNNIDIQYIYHEGYEVVDIASYVYGRTQTFGDAYIIYSNNVPVKCEKDENDKCLDFGTPITTEKVKTLR